MNRWLAVAFVCLLAAASFFAYSKYGAGSEVRSVVLPIDVPVLAAGPGREMYAAKCMACHSSRYVTMQPEFPRKVWENEVAKMIKVYGAVVSDEQVPEIVEYLTAIRGVKAN